MRKIRKTLFGRLILLLAPLFAAATFSACYGPGPNRIPDSTMSDEGMRGSVSESAVIFPLNDAHAPKTVQARMKNPVSN